MTDTVCIKDKTIEELEEPLHTFPLGKASYYREASLTLLAEVKRLRERLGVIEDFINDELRAFVNSNTFDHIYDAIEKKLEVIE
tara:strand:+ start:201 stop:452 length:252 start_codon:yes stop_codon:yes gene_type:complete